MGASLVPRNNRNVSDRDIREFSAVLMAPQPAWAERGFTAVPGTLQKMQVFRLEPPIFQGSGSKPEHNEHTFEYRRASPGGFLT